MPRITDLDVMEIRQVFEDAMSRAQMPISAKKCDSEERFAMRYTCF